MQTAENKGEKLEKEQAATVEQNKAELLPSESPFKRLLAAFFKRKVAVAALALLLALFAFVFIAPAFVPLDINQTDALAQNLPPNYSLCSPPQGLQDKVRQIDGFASFSVGLDKDGTPYVWGSAKDVLSGVRMDDLPQSLQGGVAHIAAGKDHALAITYGGELVGWGEKSQGQYGKNTLSGIVPIPDFLSERIDTAGVRSLVCGYQSSAIVFTDGRAYLWGNGNVVRNLAELSSMQGIKQVAFTTSSAVLLKEDGSLLVGSGSPFLSAVSMRYGKQSALLGYLQGKRAVEIAAANKCIAVLLEDGDVLLSGVFEYGEDNFPALLEGEHFTQLAGGARHFVGVTDRGNCYAWGDNGYGQCEVGGVSGVSRVFAGSMQSYAVDGEGKLVRAVGLKGYLMGTDGRGRDVFARIVHGGKMTLTIGGVAVIVSSLIAILVGCISGYFGGGVDVVLMRITEIFAAIPFLPFAMLLSQIIKYYNLTENTRIFIIMLILGVLSWTGLARIIRGQVLAEREKEFVTAAKAMGVPPYKIAFRHVLPNIVSVILVSMTLDFAGCLLTESALSYLGFGVQQPTPTWGNMLSGCNNSTVIQYYWWQWLFPSLFLSLAVVCINVVGDALRDALDPKKQKG